MEEMSNTESQLEKLSIDLLRIKQHGHDVISREMQDISERWEDLVSRIPQLQERMHQVCFEVQKNI